MRFDYESDIREAERENARQDQRERNCPRLVGLRERIDEALSEKHSWEVIRELEMFRESIGDRILYGKDVTEEGDRSLTERLAKIVSGA